MQDVSISNGEGEQARREIAVQVAQRRWIMLAGYCVPFIVPACFALLVFAA